VAVTGDVDADTAPVLLAALTKVIRPGRRVCCDLSATSFFGAAGANVLALAHLRAARESGRFAVRGARGLAAQVLDLSGLRNILTINP
ncbi:STAS domain-containing protein, partial [Actinoplanes sp. NPDC051633]|uniref:STAS domain-containing protein n=1 Tax=Actinoplanes sp. NPDC051633 TaxID=3155670 RepID=UPI003436CA61